MKYSFIIPTVDRIDELQKCVSSIENACKYARPAELEILIVVNGGLADKGRVKAGRPELVRFFAINGKSVSAARNLGIRESRGEYLIFLDDDAMIKNDFLKVLNELVLRQNAQIFYARILSADGKHPFTDVYSRDQEKKLGYFDYFHSGGTSLIIKRDVFEKIGVYDEQFGPGGKYHAAEETDLYFKMISTKLKIVYVPDLVVYHPISEQTDSDKVYKYSFSIGAVLAKHSVLDRAHWLIYMLIYNSVLFKSFFRMLQNVVFPAMLAAKNKRYKYASVFKGAVDGFLTYLKDQRGLA